MPSSDSATAREPPTPHHGSEPINEQHAMDDRQREADTPTVSLQLDVFSTHEPKMALRELPGTDYVCKSVNYLGMLMQ